ncbi:hypothetical protein [uncultured Endozoicomonas sp.]|uniref:hypothetical protein n=1 Tax=uncultured Endozoicomonas sp. TaxID=432652 RepID=UPI00262F4773|nr:hypothetical protein [uncultured Endozoicomonas sp.]
MLPSVVDSVVSASSAPSSLLINSVMGFSSPAAVLNPGRKSSKGTAPEHRRQVVRGAMIPMVGVLGKTLVSGVAVHATGVGGWLHVVLALAGHKYSGKAVINDAPYFLKDEHKINLTRRSTAGGSYFTYNGNGINIAVYDGGQTDVSHLPTLQSAGWSNDMIGNGIVLAHIHLRDDKKLYPNGFPEFSFLLDASERIDSQQAPSLSSDVILRYLRNDLEAADLEIDLESFEAARIVCNEPVVTAAGANENRYTAGGAYDYDEAHSEILERLLQTCGGKLVYQYGRFSLYVATYYGEPVLELTEADIIGDVEITPMPERRDLANIIKGSYTDALSGYQSADFPEVGSERYLLEDGEELEDDFDLEFVQSSDQAQRLASLELNRHRLLTLKAPFNFRAFPAKVGRIIRLNTPTIGFNHPFMVESWEFDTKKGVALTLREDFAELWGDYIGAVPSRPPSTTLPGAGDIDPPSNGQIAEFQQFGDWIAELTWSHPFPGSVQRYYVTVDRMKADGENWIAETVASGETTSTRYRFTVPTDGQFRAIITAENAYGVVSDPYEYWYISSIPTLEITEISAESVDVTAYPARALIKWQVERLDSFDLDTVIFTVETRPFSGNAWLPVTKTSSVSCWVEGLAHGQHEIRVKAEPPFGSVTGWRVGSFTVEAVTVPVNLKVDPTEKDSTTAGVLSWMGAGQSFDVEMRKNGVLWAGGSVSTREWQVPACEPGVYSLRVRARAGDVVSDFAELDWKSAELPAPKNLVFNVTPQNAASSGLVSWQSGGASQFTSGYELHLIDNAGNIDLRTITQGTEYLLPVVLPGAYTVKVRAVSTSGAYFSPWAEDSGSISGLMAPKDLKAVESIVGAGATLQQSIAVSWKAGDDLAQSYELEYRLLSSDEWSGGYSGAATSAILTSLAPGDYYFRVRARLAGVSSPYAQTLVTVQGLERAPDNITGAQFRAISSTIALLSWDLMNDPTVLTGGSIQVRWTYHTGSAATWEAGVKLTDRLPGNATLANVPLLSGTYMVKAVNAFSKWSETAAIVVSNLGNMLNYNRIVERDEPKTWPGESHGVVIDQGTLTLSGSGAYYVMDEPIDLKAAFTVRLTLQMDGSVYLPDLIDDRTDKIDDWPMFDGQDPGNTSLIYEVSQTDDDPASSSAKWSEWTQFLVGEFRARAFRIRVSLSTEDESAVGTIAGLKLIADAPDRIERGVGIACPAAGLSVKYNRAFLAPASVGITGQGMQAGDRFEQSNSTAEGFDIKFFNNAGSAIARTFDYFAISYGEQ